MLMATHDDVWRHASTYDEETRHRQRSDARCEMWRCMTTTDVQWRHTMKNDNGWWQRWLLIPVGSYYCRAN